MFAGSFAEFKQMGRLEPNDRVSYSSEEMKQLFMWVEEHDRFQALAKAHEALILNRTGEVDLLRKAMSSLKRYTEILEGQNEYLRGMLAKEMAKPRMPYPEWVEPIRIGAELAMVGTIIVETTLLIMSAKGIIF